ncbi:hypothetical protein A1O1_08961 [Capronia coronata CBS 617.96]|uniref:Cell wall mannoprotein PIR1-like C-terminal domain-containing protein n=1 Tax=Capronia coronata CBS 617.96 TaxID=1182541 RepID=W9XMK7_9EURO|nr:uncharacterized protein A1O1_08961 [Capronia coronata CBS 617.96]EXJ78560.1 hypothetical protein A1O1_08961 [Capronia coronata CBS 617.96]
MAEVSQIGDGQIQGGMHTITMTMTMTPVSQIGDGQIQNPAETTTTTTTDLSTVSPPPGSLSAPSTPSRGPAATRKPPTVIEQACGFETRPSIPFTFTFPSIPSPSTSESPTTSPTTSMSDSSMPTPTTSPNTNPNVNSSSGSTSTSNKLPFVSCLTNSTLRLALTDGTLLDSRNRTGYIASNYQFQFDGPPQSGALYTTGWSICPSGPDSEGSTRSSSSSLPTLALGGNTTFWQCLSGDFYNLYTENWAAQCSPVELRIVSLVEC